MRNDMASRMILLPSSHFLTREKTISVVTINSHSSNNNYKKGVGRAKRNTKMHQHTDRLCVFVVDEFYEFYNYFYWPNILYEFTIKGIRNFHLIKT